MWNTVTGKHENVSGGCAGCIKYGETMKYTRVFKNRTEHLHG